MKLSARDGIAFIARPDPGVGGVLIAGEDGAQVAARRADLIATLIGPQGEAEMRLTRIAAGELRADPAALIDAAKAAGFFPGPRAVLVDGATDGLAEAIGGALAGWQKGDATIVVTGGDLKPKSGLRKLFEAAKQAVAIILYDDPPGPEEIAALCQKAGIAALSAESRAELADLAGGLDTGTFRRLIDTLGLYKRGDATPLTVAEISALAPPQIGAETDALLAVVAEGRVAEIAELLRRVVAQGTAPTKLCIDGLRHFRLLLALACDPEGPASAAGRARPPINFKRRDSVIRQAQALGRERIERALALLVDTDLTLRSSSRAPQEALVERALIRIAMSRGR